MRTFPNFNRHYFAAGIIGLLMIGATSYGLLTPDNLLVRSVQSYVPKLPIAIVYSLIGILLLAGLFLFAILFKVRYYSFSGDEIAISEGYFGLLLKVYKASIDRSSKIHIISIDESVGTGISNYRNSFIVYIVFDNKYLNVYESQVFDLAMNFASKISEKFNLSLVDSTENDYDNQNEFERKYSDKIELFEERH